MGKKKAKTPKVEVPQVAQAPNTAVVADNRRRRRAGSRGPGATAPASLLTNGGAGAGAGTGPGSFSNLLGSLLTGGKLGG
jgi:hypothetical protein